MADAQDTEAGDLDALLAAVPEATPLRVYAVIDAEHCVAGFRHWRSAKRPTPDEARRRQRQILFRDSEGRYWATDPDSGRWFVHGRGQWQAGRPKGPLEGPDAARDFAPAGRAAGNLEPIADEAERAAPTDTSLARYADIICAIGTDYRDGRLTSVDATLLLRQHMIADTDAALWNVGCRSGRWYRFDGQQWQGSEQPPIVSSAVPDAEAEAARQWSVLLFMAAGVDVLPEPVTAPWQPPADLPAALPAATCHACGAALAAGQRFCTHCGAKRAAPAPACPNCGAALTAGQKFCTHCGTRLAPA